MLDRTKQHLKNNKVAYFVGVSGVVVGAIGTIFVLLKTSLSNVTAIQALAYKSVQVIEVHVEALGDPGNIVQDLTTGTIYASQGQAAKALGASPSMVSRHLSGELDEVKGHILKKLGKAMVSEA